MGKGHGQAVDAASAGIPHRIQQRPQRTSYAIKKGEVQLKAKYIDMETAEYTSVLHVDDAKSLE